MSQLKRYSLSKQVADSLEKLIRDGRYKIGERIPTEVVLMEQFGVSRNTIREAIQSLVSAGILVVRQGAGTFVTSNDRFAALLDDKSSNLSYEECLEAREAIEISLSALAAKRRTTADLKKMKEALDNRTFDFRSDGDKAIADIDFHMAISGAAHNKILDELYQSLHSYLLTHVSKVIHTTSMTKAEIDELHYELYKAIEEQNIDKARECAYKILEI